MLSVKFKLFMVLLFAATMGYAESFKYPNDDMAVISIEFPQDWSVNSYDNYFQAASDNELMQFDLSILESYESIQQAIDSLNILLDSIYDDFRVLKMYKLSQAKFGAYKVEANGFDVLGEELSINVVIFEPEPLMVCMIVSSCDVDSVNEHHKIIDRIIRSMKKYQSN